MRYSDNAKWCYLSSWCAYLSPRSWQFMGLVLEIDNLDKAHKRAKRALRQQQRIIDVKNMIIKDLELEIEALTEQLEFYEDMEMLSIFNEDIEY